MFFHVFFVMFARNQRSNQFCHFVIFEKFLVLKNFCFICIRDFYTFEFVETTYRLFLTSNSKRTTLRSLFDLTFDIICI